RGTPDHELHTRSRSLAAPQRRKHALEALNVLPGVDNHVGVRGFVSPEAQPFRGHADRVIEWVRPTLALRRSEDLQREAYEDRGRHAARGLLNHELSPPSARAGARSEQMGESLR